MPDDQHETLAAPSPTSAVPGAGADLFAAVLRAATEYSIVGTDLNGVITVFNEGAERMLGYRAAEVVGLHTPLIFHAPAEVAARAAELGVAPDFGVFVTQARQGDAETREWTYVRQDGARLTVSLTVSAMRAPMGEVAGYIGIARDVTERRRAEAEQARLLRQAEAAEVQLRGLVESAPDAMVIVDGEGRIVRVNRQTERLFGYPRAELLGQLVEVLLPERFRHAHLHHRARYEEAPTARPMGSGLALFGQRKDGTEFPTEISLSPLVLAGVTQVIATVRDITERLALQQAAERQKDEFIANVSHDLRTPLTAIKASIGVVLANEPTNLPAALHRMLVNVDLAADRMTALVADLLELARLQARRAELSPGRCDLRKLAQQVASTIEPLVEARGQQLEVDLPTEPVWGEVDAGRLERALLNLLSNAHNYGGEGGHIRFCLESDQDEVRFSVTDDGPGIPPTEQAHIFERFYRPETDSTRRTPGAGLGLPIARALVELHGGRIGVQSAPGEGSTFWIALPTQGRARPEHEEAEP